MKPHYRKYYRYTTDEPYYTPPIVRQFVGNRARNIIPRPLVSEAFTTLYTAPLLLGFAGYATYQEYLDRQAREKQVSDERQDEIARQVENLQYQRDMRDTLDLMKIDDEELLAQMVDLVNYQKATIRGLADGLNKLVESAYLNANATISSAESSKRDIARLKESIDKITEVISGNEENPYNLIDSVNILTREVQTLTNEIKIDGEVKTNQIEEIIYKLSNIQPGVANEENITRLIDLQQNVNEALDKVITSTDNLTRQLESQGKVSDRLLEVQNDNMNRFFSLEDKQQKILDQLSGTIDKIITIPTQQPSIPTPPPTPPPPPMFDTREMISLEELKPQELKPSATQEELRINKLRRIKVDDEELLLPDIKLDIKLPKLLDKRYTASRYVGKKEEEAAVYELLRQYTDRINVGININDANAKFGEDLSQLYGRNIYNPKVLLSEILLRPNSYFPPILFNFFTDPRIRDFLNNPIKITQDTAWAELYGKSRSKNMEKDQEVVEEYIKNRYIEDIARNKFGSKYNPSSPDQRAAVMQEYENIYRT